MPLAKVYPEKDIQIHYELHGTGPKKLLLVMGFLTDSAVWESQWKYFEGLGDFEVCSFDNRGIGGSSAPRAPYTTTMFAEDALALVDYLGWSSFHVVGLSMGGMIATELAYKVPERIITLQLIATHTGDPITSFPPITGLVRCIWSLFIPPFKFFQPYANDNLLRTLYGQKSLKEKRLELYDLHLERCTQCWKTSPQGILGQLCAVGSHFVRKDHLLKLRYSGIPLSLLVGTEDILVRCENSHVLQRILGCPLVIFEGCGHNLQKIFQKSMPVSMITFKEWNHCLSTKMFSIGKTQLRNF
jgi:pimeloyl-ACP methyl ester carboxylesterase